MDKDELFKEIDLIQGCISRMARNSFLIKGWAITLFAAAIAFYSSKGSLSSDNRGLLLWCTIIVPLVLFWALDAYFLRTERKYRCMYKWVLRERAEDSTAYQYDLDPTRFDKEVGCCLRTFFSPTLLLFYGLPLLAIIILTICYD